MDAKKKQEFENRLGNKEKMQCPKCGYERTFIFCVERHSWVEDRYYLQCTYNQSHRIYIN